MSQAGAGAACMAATHTLGFVLQAWLACASTASPGAGPRCRGACSALAGLQIPLAPERLPGGSWDGGHDRLHSPSSLTGAATRWHHASRRWPKQRSRVRQGAPTRTPAAFRPPGGGAAPVASSRPSISVSSAESSRAPAPPPSPPSPASRRPPSASISSMNRMAGAAWHARANAPRRRASPSPTYALNSAAPSSTCGARGRA